MYVLRSPESEILVLRIGVLLNAVPAARLVQYLYQILSILHKKHGELMYYVLCSVERILLAFEYSTK